jgi:hypothetical protein
MTRLSLVVYKEYFDAIVVGTKKIEYRSASEYWIDQLTLTPPGCPRIERQFDEVEFRNGYQKNAPRARFICGLIKLVKERGEFEIHIGARLR